MAKDNGGHLMNALGWMATAHPLVIKHYNRGFLALADAQALAKLPYAAQETNEDARLRFAQSHTGT